MKLSGRLMACAGLVRPGGVAVDVGTDHGHLPIYLLERGICPRVIAADLREKPLNAARRNAGAAGAAEHILFCRSDGLREVPMDGVTTVICAGMGGDTIQEILLGAKEYWRPELQLILQPQAGVPELRRFLGDHGFAIRQEVFAADGGFIYCVMEVFWGEGTPLTPGQSYRPQGRVDRTSPLCRAYMARVRNSLKATAEGISRAKIVDTERKRFYESALAELDELEGQYADSE